MSGAVLPSTSAEAGSGVRSSGRTAAGWLPVNGTGPVRGTEAHQDGELGHRAVVEPVGVLDRADEVAKELEADRAVDRPPRQQRTHANGLVDRRVVPAEHVDRGVA